MEQAFIDLERRSRDGGAERFDRRTLASLSQDVYVAETPAGAIVGVVAVGYLRSLREGRHTAVLETARVAPDTGPLLEALLDLAEERARRRGCRHVRAWPDADDAALRVALAGRGWCGADTLLGTVPCESIS
jgi:hypothetical protein